MLSEIEILKQVCSKLEMFDIPYMLTGSFAANLYITPRMTRDIDIVIELQKANIDKIVQIFKDSFYIDRDSIVGALKHCDMFNIIHSELMLKIDFIIRKEEEYRFTEFQRKRKILFDDSLVWVVSPEDLIISKLYWAKDSLSEMQMKDVRALLKFPKLDLEYILKWIKKMNLDLVYEKVAYA